MEISHDSRRCFFPGPVGDLEAILWTSTRFRTPPLAAVLCHPHPLFGGTFHNKVVYQAAKSLDSLGIPVLRFNFRGAGMSAGVHDNGRGEQGDAQAAVDFLAAEFPDTPLLLGGFSFGSWVGLRIGCSDPRVTDLIGIGVPLDSSDFTYLWSCAKAKLFVHGTDDAFGAPQKVEELVAELPGENRLVFVEAADHFFAGHLAEFDRAITTWLIDRHRELGNP
ncbi:MAG TPA: alpha/beta family hydrolase [Candidatus Acidoferrum sp.]|nr:alpha/beta family hydrolase [Candidatus Acidoferrum sp.]